MNVVQRLPFGARESAIILAEILFFIFISFGYIKESTNTEHNKQVQHNPL
jgi:hypothetical protein